jgi:hypothetical protein
MLYRPPQPEQPRRRVPWGRIVIYTLLALYAALKLMQVILIMWSWH